MIVLDRFVSSIAILQNSQVYRGAIVTHFRGVGTATAGTAVAVPLFRATVSSLAYNITD